MNAETVLNRNVTERGAFARPPLLAAVQVQLYAQGWSVGRVRRVRRDVGKLGLALAPPADARAAYLCILQRDVGSQPTRWDRHWPVVERVLAGAPGICAVVAVCWPHAALEPFVHYTGPWITVAV